MTSRKYLWLAIVGVLTIALIDGSALAARGGGGRGGGGFRGGGGGYRGGGGSFSRPSYSGSGSIRYSSPSRSYSRPSTPSYSRPSSVRPSTPSVSPRPSGGSVARPSTPSYRPSTPVGAARPATGAPARGSAVARPSTPTYRPGNSGSVINSGTITTPGGATIGGITGPRGGGAVGIKGPEGGAAGAVRGPAGGGAAGVRGPGGGAAGAVRGPGGGAAAGVVGPGGGAAGAVRGPGGGTAGAVRGPGGAGAAGVRGPYGGAAGAVWGPGGHWAAGAWGRHGGGYITNLPDGAFHHPWHDHDYWCFGFNWYTPCWVGDSVYYSWAYPPLGYYYPSLPPEYNTTVINNTTYYESEGVYYQEGEKDGQKGYVVAEAPEGTESTKPEGENPFKILKSMCDSLAGIDKLSAVAQTTTDELGASGEKVQFSARRMIYVSRPNKVAVDVTGDKGTRRFVYDGKTVSMLDSTKNIYSAIEVPGTIDGALDTLARDYGIPLPLGDLLYKDLYKRLEARISAGQYLGLHEVNGLKCHHLAFLTQTASCEIWIETGDKPVPRKITIDYGQDSARSRYAAEMFAWTASPTFSAGTFELKLPAVVRRIQIAPIATPTTTPAAPAATPGKAG